MEVGCGDGGMTSLLSAKVGQITAMDASCISLSELQKRGLPNVRVLAGLVETAPISEQFDWIVMSEVIEHLRHPAPAVRRCVDLLAPGGSLLLTTPNGHWESDEHLHVFSIESLSSLLAKSGAETICTGFLRDSEGKRRWLSARLVKAERPPSPDCFHDRRAVARMRRRSSG